MANIIVLAGESGTGKSTSIRNLDPKETFIINTLGKRLPFKSSTKIYNKENKNYLHTDNYATLKAALENINEKAAHIKTVILDDIDLLMKKDNFSQAKTKGFDKYVDMAVNFQSLIGQIEKLRNDLNVILFLHLSDVTSDKRIVAKEVDYIGNMIKKQYDIPQVVTVFLCSICVFKENGEAEYLFITNHAEVDGVRYPAKSPMEMFEDIFIPNDLKLVIDAMQDFY